MKKILFYILAATMLFACNKKGTEPDNGKKPSFEELFCSEWHSTEVALDGADIYLKFSDDKTFEQYQMITEGAYRLYRGTWNLEGNILTGKYNDGEDLAASYDVTITDNTMTLTSKNDAAEVSTFEKCEIPEDVKSTCEIVVKSTKR